jgi:hypothetical protein
MFLFDRSGKTVRVLFGAPPNLHEEAEKALDQLMQGGAIKGGVLK